MTILMHDEATFNPSPADAAWAAAAFADPDAYDLVEAADRIELMALAGHEHTPEAHDAYREFLPPKLWVRSLERVLASLGYTAGAVRELMGMIVEDHTAECVPSELWLHESDRELAEGLIPDAPCGVWGRFPGIYNAVEAAVGRR